MDYAYDWSVKTTTNNIEFEMPVKKEEKGEKNSSRQKE
jgi:hypothetical protein